MLVEDVAAPTESDEEEEAGIEPEPELEIDPSYDFGDGEDTTVPAAKEDHATQQKQ